MRAFFLLPFLALALAQIAFPPEAFYRALGAKEAYAGGRVELELKNGRLYRARFLGPMNAGALGRFLEAATGQKGLAEAFVRWYAQNAQGLEGRLIRVSLSSALLELDLREKGRVGAVLAPVEVKDFGPDRHVLGGKGVYVRVFSDFECPYCRKLFREVLPWLEKEAEKGRLSISYRHFPLYEIHPQAVAAATASECAAEQGAFWPYHDLLMQSPLGEYLGLARRLGLDEEKFSACLKDGAARARVMEERKRAEALGLKGTPTVFVGPFLLPDPYRKEVYEAYLELAR